MAGIVVGGVLALVGFYILSLGLRGWFVDATNRRRPFVGTFKNPVLAKRLYLAGASLTIMIGLALVGLGLLHLS